MKVFDPRFESGWHAALELKYARQNARTILASRRHSGPLLVQKALYPELDVCHSVILHPPAGIAGGDVLRLEVELAAGSKALLTTPGATKWYRAQDQPARQILHFDLAPHASLEWLPQENIVFDGSRAEMELEVRLGVGAVYCGWEVCCLGRLASGERFRNGYMRSTSSVYYDDDLIWRERGRFAGGDRLLDSPIGLAGKRVFGSFIAAADVLPSALLQTTRALGGPPGCAITQLPKIWIARYLGDSTEAARNYFRALWQLVRPKLLARTAIAPRIWNT